SLLQAAVMGSMSTVGATVYTTHSPCHHCFKALAVAGVTRIVAGADYQSPAVVEARKYAKIVLDYYQPSPEWAGRLAEAFKAPIENYVSKA
ncbi:MAG TPA: deaminase, partial [Candidatus Eisenbacteria bacterium]|nr:deaminase [Candidatus Eisenbacteria bacterium]